MRLYCNNRRKKTKLTSTIKSARFIIIYNLSVFIIVDVRRLCLTECGSHVDVAIQGWALTS